MTDPRSRQICRPSSDAVDRWPHLLALARAGGYLRAPVPTIERANGAFAATPRDPSADRWTQQQDNAADTDESEALLAFQDAAEKLPVARSELLAAGVPAGSVRSVLDAEAQAIKSSISLFESLAWGARARHLERCGKRCGS